ALEWARAKAHRGGREVSEAVAGALIRLGNCLDLTEIAHTTVVAEAYEGLRAIYEAAGRPLTRNRGSDIDLKRRNLDCLGLNYCVGVAAVAYGMSRAPFG